MLNTIYMTCISCKSRDWYESRIVRPKIENAASARASGSFYSKYLLHKKRVLFILSDKCWDSLYAICEVLVILFRKRTLVNNAHRASISYYLQKYQ